jgi:hypothetical protein
MPFPGNYSMGCQWKELPIAKDLDGRPEIHDTRIYGAFRRWQADGCFEAIFAGSVLKLHQADLLDTTVIHGDGTTTAAKKGGDNIGFSGHKKVRRQGRGFLRPQLQHHRAVCFSSW